MGDQGLVRRLLLDRALGGTRGLGRLASDTGDAPALGDGALPASSMASGTATLDGGLGGMAGW